MGTIRKSDLELVRPMKSGGMANLTYALTPERQPVVLRELLPQFALRPIVRLRFIRGMRLREHVCPHPHIVCSYARAVFRPRPYEIIEYLNAANLRDLVMNDYEKAQLHAMHILRGVAEALAHIHSKGLVHLDVKSENVLVGSEPDNDNVTVVKLTDFDLCRRLKNHSGYLRSGTASYMAPEQLAKGKVACGNDIFAFGVMAYYLVTRRMPFSGESIKEVRQQQISWKHEVREPKRFVPDISPKLNQIIMGCLEKNPEKRLPSMVYLAQELRRI